MKIDFAIWSDCDNSVGLNGVSFKATFEIQPEPDFAAMESGEAKAFRDSIELELKKVLARHADYFDCDMPVHIATMEELKQIIESESEGEL